MLPIGLFRSTFIVAVFDWDFRNKGVNVFIMNSNKICNPGFFIILFFFLLFSNQVTKYIVPTELELSF